MTRFLSIIGFYYLVVTLCTKSAELQHVLFDVEPVSWLNQALGVMGFFLTVLHIGVTAEDDK